MSTLAISFWGAAGQVTGSCHLVSSARPCVEWPITRAFCVHGEPTALQAMKSLLEAEGVSEVHIPKHGERAIC